MSDFLNELGLDTQAFNEAEAQEVGSGFKVLESGVYVANINLLCTFMTKNGAKMMMAKIIIPSEDDREITVYQNITKKNGEPNTIGTATFKHILDATGLDLSTLSTADEKLKTYGYESDCKVVKGIAKANIKVCVRQVFEEGAEYEDYNEIEAYLLSDGTNSKGENIEDAFKEKIAKTPVLKRKAKEVTKKEEPKADSSIADLV